MCEKCNELRIPKHLHRKGREEDPIFKSETIYRRFNVRGSVEDWKNDRGISASIFPVKNDSCNRAKYSQKPEDVLYNTREIDSGKHYFYMGILSFKSDHIEKFSESVYTNNKERIFKLKMKHEPLVCMFPHCEILVYEGEELIEQGKPKSIKALVRDILLTNVEIIKHPEKKISTY